MKKFTLINEREEKDYSKRFAALVMATLYFLAMMPFSLFAEEVARENKFYSAFTPVSIVTESVADADAESAQEVALAPLEKKQTEVSSVKKQVVKKTVSTPETVDNNDERKENIQDKWGDNPLEVKSLITKKEGGIIQLGDVSIEIPAGAVKKDTEITIKRLEEVNETGDMLDNVTNLNGGYRFLPAGTKFKKKVTVSIPYSKEINNNEQKLNDLYTYFYDTKENRWVKLERKEIDRENCVVRSYTTHFTDMINGTISMPETASAASFDINSIKGLEAAKPDGHIIKFNPPAANNQGDASFSFNLDIPAGRLGLQPVISVSYSSGSGNGIIGKGFNVNYGSVISTDTRNGFPKYDGFDNYMKDGVLLELDSDRSTQKKHVYTSKKITGYEKIVRYNPGSDEDDYWEVTNSEGLISRYGKYNIFTDETNNSCSRATYYDEMDKDGSGNAREKTRVFEWYLSEMEDIHGNTVLFTYEQDKGYVYPKLIRYTGKKAANGNSSSQNSKGNYFVRFDYYYTDSDDEKAKKRPDVRTDARSRSLKECRWLLKQISAGYDPSNKADVSYSKNDLTTWINNSQKNVSNRVYEFVYADYNADFIETESFLNELKIWNKGMDDSYSYYFDYNRINKNNMFASPVQLYKNDSDKENFNTFILNTGNSMGAGANVRIQAGVGFGTAVADGRVTGGVNGSVDGSFGYTDNTLADIDGDGIPDGLNYNTEANKNNITVRYGKNASDEYNSPGSTTTIDVRELNREDSSSVNFGWSVYGGVGLKNKYITGIGGSVNGVTQEGTTSVSRSLMDVDGDGLVDVIESKKSTYLKNLGNGNFEPRPIYTVSVDPIRDIAKILTEDELIQYRDTYIPQTPFRVWKAPYTGIINIKSTVKKAENFDAKIIAETYIGDAIKNELCITLSPKTQNEITKTESVKVLKDQNLYFYVNSGFEPKNTDINWDIDIKYDSIEPLQTAYRLPYFILKNEIEGSFYYGTDRKPSLSDVRKKLESSVYGNILPAYDLTYKLNASSDQGGNISGYKVEYTLTRIDDWYERLDDSVVKKITSEIINGGYGDVIPGCYTIEEFNELSDSFRDSYEGNNIPFISQELKDLQLRSECVKFTSIFRYNVDKGVFELCDLNTSQRDTAWKNIFSKLSVKDKYKNEYLRKYKENRVFNEEKYLYSFGKGSLSYGVKEAPEEMTGKRHNYDVGTYSKITEKETDKDLYELYLGNIEGKRLTVVSERPVFDVNTELKILIDGKTSQKITEPSLTLDDDNNLCIDFVYNSKQNVRYKVKGRGYVPSTLNEEDFKLCYDTYKQMILNDRLSSDEVVNLYVGTQLKNLKSKKTALNKAKEALDAEKAKEDADLETIDQLEEKVNECEEALAKAIEAFDNKYAEHYSLLNGAYKLEDDVYVVQDDFEVAKTQEDFTTVNEEEQTIFDMEAFANYLSNQNMFKLLSEELYLYNAKEISVGIDFFEENEYVLKENQGKTSYEILTLNAENDFEIKTNYIAVNSWDAAEDFTNEDVYGTKEVFDGLTYTVEAENEEGKDVTLELPYVVYRDEKLYGGNKNWYFGVWQGNKKFAVKRIYETKEDYSNMSEKDVNEKQKQDALNPSNKEDAKKQKDNTGEINSFYNPMKNEREVEAEKEFVKAIEKEDGTNRGVNEDVEHILLGNISTVSKFDTPTDFKTSYYAPYIYKNFIHANRLGGTSYYDIEGIVVEQSFDGNINVQQGDTGPGQGISTKRSLEIPTIRKTETTADDIVWGLNVKGKVLGMDVQLNYDSASGFGAGAKNESENESKNKILQYYQDINGDRIPDFIQYEADGVISVTPGYKIYDETSSNIEGYEIVYGEKYYIKGVSKISFTENTTVTKGGNVTEKGVVTPKYTSGGKFKGAEPNASSDGSGNESVSEGSSHQRQGLMDINGDGLPDYLNKNSVLINQGYNFISYGKYENMSDSITKSENESLAITKSLKNGPGQAESLSNGAVLGASIVFNYSRNNTKFLYMDVNGDGLPDILTKEIGSRNKKRELTPSDDWKVQFNMGNTFTSPMSFNMPGWNLDSDDCDKMKKKHDTQLKLFFIEYIPYIGQEICNIVTNLVFDNPFASGKDDYKELKALCNSLDLSMSSSIGLAASVGGTGTGSIPIPFTPCTVNITAEAGAGVNANTSINGLSVSMQDITGDGLPDHVLRIPGKAINGADVGYIYYKKNLTGEAGLLKAVHTPNGGSVEIKYEGKLGTPKMPSYKYVMSSTTVYDGNGETVPAVDYKYGDDIALEQNDSAEFVHETTTKYQYKDARYNRDEHEFYGYGEVTTVNPDGTYVVVKYNNDTSEYYKKGAVITQEVYSGDKYHSDILISKTQNTYDETKKPALLLKTVETYEYEYDGSQVKLFETSSNYEYDDYYNVKTLIQNYNDASITDVKAEISYYKNDALNIYSKPSSIVVKELDTGKVIRERKAGYTDGNMTSITFVYVDALGDTKETETYFSYDGFGNIIEMTTPAKVIQLFEYDPNVNQFVTKVKEKSKDGNSTYETSYETDYSIQLTKHCTDLNNLTLKYDYDKWQRISKVFSPYDTSNPAVSFEYKAPVSEATYKNGVNTLTKHGFWYSLTKNKVSFDSSDTKYISTIVQTDGLGRVLRTLCKTSVFQGKDIDDLVGYSVSGSVILDEMNRSVITGQNYFIREAGVDFDSTDDIELFVKNPTVNKFDEKGRSYLSKCLFEEKSPDSDVSTLKWISKKTEYKPAGNELHVKVTDPRGNSTETIVNAKSEAKEIIKLDENDNTVAHTYYEYDAMGQMTKATAYEPGNSSSNNTELISTVEVVYDNLGRKVKLSTTDGGSYYYTYDVTGNLLTETNDKLIKEAKSINYSYDGFNRISEITYSDDEKIRYEYGETLDNTYSKGRIKKVYDLSGTKTLSYGKLGQVEKETRSINEHIIFATDDKTYTMKYVSNYLGQMEEITYPDGEVLKYTYNEYGKVTGIDGRHFGKDFCYVKSICYNEDGQRVYIEYGNGVSTEYKYNEYNKLLDSVMTKKDNYLYQNIHYYFDTVGNIKGYVNDCRDNGIFKNTNNYYTKQTYNYDALNQLVHVSGESVFNKHGTQLPTSLSKYEQTFEYDMLGNMMKKDSSQIQQYRPRSGDDLNYSLDYKIQDGYAHRLERAGDRFYQYDEVGNIIAEQKGEFSQEIEEYVPVDEYSGDVHGVEGAWGYTEDSASASKTNNKNYKREYTWNAKNQLIKSQDSTCTVNFVYDADGKRACKYTDKTEFMYFNDYWSWHYTEGSSAHGGMASKHIFLNGSRLLTKVNHDNTRTASYDYENEHQYFYHTDHLGTAQFITDHKGNEYQRLENTPYGETWIDINIQGTTSEEYVPYKFTGKELDEETGLYYYGARYLDPKYSIWISADPAMFTGEYIPDAGKGTMEEGAKLPGMGGIFNHINGNLYHYAGNNPIRYIDPDGKTTRDDFAYQLRTEGKKDDALRMECRAASAQGENIAGIITIYSSKGNNYDPYSGSIMFGNHSWLSFEDTTEENSITYYGTWGKGNKGLRENTYYEVNWQDNYPDVAKRSVPITKEQKEKLDKYVAESKKKGDKAWSHLNPCSAWASKGWENTTGEKLKHRGLIISDPNVLHKSIEEKNEQ